MQKLILFLPCLAIFIFSCNPARKLKQNEYLVRKVKIIDNHSGLDAAEIESFVRQKPNRKIVKIIPFHTTVYNLVNKEKLLKKKEKRDKKYDAINSKRIVKRQKKQNKNPNKKYKDLKLKDKNKLTFRENLLEIGEAPVVLDSMQTRISRIQIEKFMATKGFFNSTVKDSVSIEPYKSFFKWKKHLKKANVFYTISKSVPYKIKSVSYKVEDTELFGFISQDRAGCLVKAGERYDEDIMQSERERITAFLKNNGYYDFAQEYVYFLVDSNFKSHQLDITIGVDLFPYKPDETQDSIAYRNHQRFTINKIIIIPDYYTINGKRPEPADTITYHDEKEKRDLVFMLNTPPVKYKIKDLAKRIVISPGQFFQTNLAEETYNKLSDLKAFKSITINFERDVWDPTKLNVEILLSPISKQTFTVETEGTNTSGNLGMAGSFVYQNRNLFKGAELLEFKIKGGLTAQKNFETDQATTSILKGLGAFNTFQFGPELNLVIPKLLFPFNVVSNKKATGIKTIFSMSLNYQQRPEFFRTLTNLSYGFQTQPSPNYRHQFILFETNIISANLSQAFKDKLAQSNDNFLLNSFIDHLTPVSRYTFTYNDQNTIGKKRSTSHFLKANFESSGNIARAFFNLTGREQDSLGRYQVFKIPFSQFLRFDLDYRIYKTIRKLGRVVFRAAGGYGHSLKNLSVLPYEKSFFGGGPNSIRAWKARALGPGAYAPDSLDGLDKLGELQMEFNLEYRFNIFKLLNGAWFVDAGNIWLRRPVSSRPNGNFELNRFYKEFATGSGFGIRADFSFFIIRLDASVKIYDPGDPTDGKYIFNKHIGTILKGTNLNFGIGYPF